MATTDLDLANRDLDPTKVPALATFLAASRNCQTVDVRGNRRLSSADGEELAAALLDNFHACPVPKFITHGKKVSAYPCARWINHSCRQQEQSNIFNKQKSCTPLSLFL